MSLLPQIQLLPILETAPSVTTGPGPGPLVLALLGVALGGLLGGWLLARRGPAPAGPDPAELTTRVVDTVVSVASSKLGDQLAAGQLVLQREQELVTDQVAGVRQELGRVAGLVAELQKERAHAQGRLDQQLEASFRATASLADTTRSLERALASPKARGQWGERMAEDVLRAAGFVEGVNFVKQTKAAGGGVPDFTFPLPQGHLVHMDVKFPIDNYVRWLDAADDEARGRQVKLFRRDVRQRIAELGARRYVDPDTTVDYVLLFVPNESVYGFLHEHDPELVDVALGQKVVLCSPTTLFAVLAVIRQAVDNFLVERRSGEILSALGGLREQWNRLSEPLDKMGRGLASAQRAFDDLNGKHHRAFEKQLGRLESLRDERAAEVGPSSDDDQPVAGLRSVG